MATECTQYCQSSPLLQGKCCVVVRASLTPQTKEGHQISHCCQRRVPSACKKRTPPPPCQSSEAALQKKNSDSGGGRRANMCRATEALIWSERRRNKKGVRSLICGGEYSLKNLAHHINGPFGNEIDPTFWEVIPTHTHFDARFCLFTPLLRQSFLPFHTPFLDKVFFPCHALLRQTFCLFIPPQKMYIGSWKTIPQQQRQEKQHFPSVPWSVGCASDKKLQHYIGGRMLCATLTDKWGGIRLNIIFRRCPLPTAKGKTNLYTQTGK